MTFDIVPENPKRRIAITYERYTVWHDPLAHRPWGLYRIYRGAKYCGAQLSYPSKDDCEWHDKWVGTFAIAAPLRGLNEYGYSSERYRRKGRRRKAEADAELQEALAA